MSESFDAIIGWMLDNDCHKDPDGGWVSGHSHADLIKIANRLKAAHEAEIEVTSAGKDAEIGELALRKNAEIKALEDKLAEQKAINNNLVDQNGDLVADLKRSNAQYQHLVNVKSCEWDDNRKPDLITMCERLHRAIKDERTAAFAAQAAYATRREIEDRIVDLVGAIIETRMQKENENDNA